LVGVSPFGLQVISSLVQTYLPGKPSVTPPNGCSCQSYDRISPFRTSAVGLFSVLRDCRSSAVVLKAAGNRQPRLFSRPGPNSLRPGTRPNPLCPSPPRAADHGDHPLPLALIRLSGKPRPVFCQALSFFSFALPLARVISAWHVTVREDRPGVGPRPPCLLSTLP